MFLILRYYFFIGKVFFNIPYLDEKLDNNRVINDFLLALGFSRLNDGKTPKGVFKK